MENLRNRVNIELVTTEKRLRKLIKVPSFHYFKIFTPEIAGVNRKKAILYLKVLSTRVLQSWNCVKY